MIELQRVTHSFPEGHPVLRDVSMSVGSGEKVVLLGANGCGKTTLLRILAGLVFPAEGELRWRGEPVDRARLRSEDFRSRFRREVGLLFQNPGAMLFHATVREEIAFGPGQLEGVDAAARSETWAARVGVTDLLHRSPHQLSLGQQKRVALAAILAVEPSLLLLDEPTAGLDPRSTGRLVELLQEEDRTVVVTTHNLGLAEELGDRVLVLSEDHRLIHDGDFASLRAAPAKLRDANLVHIHRHRHEGEEHRHWHEHDWD